MSRPHSRSFRFETILGFEGLLKVVWGLSLLLASWTLPSKTSPSGTSVADALESFQGISCCVLADSFEVAAPEFAVCLLGCRRIAWACSLNISYLVDLTLEDNFVKCFVG